MRQRPRSSARSTPATSLQSNGSSPTIQSSPEARWVAPSRPAPRCTSWPTGPATPQRPPDRPHPHRDRRRPQLPRPRARLRNAAALGSQQRRRRRRRRPHRRRRRHRSPRRLDRNPSRQRDRLRLLARRPPPGRPRRRGRQTVARRRTRPTRPPRRTARHREPHARGSFAGVLARLRGRAAPRRRTAPRRRADLNWQPDYAHGTPLDTASGLSTRQENVIGWLKRKGRALRRHRMTKITEIFSEG
jgi:hypothetical protein